MEKKWISISDYIANPNKYGALSRPKEVGAAKLVFTFSDVQIRHMQDSITSKKRIENLIWKNAFYYYNANNKPNLSMYCGSCYHKVLAYIIANNSKETVNIDQ